MEPLSALPFLPDEPWILEPVKEAGLHLEQVGSIAFRGHQIVIFASRAGQFYFPGKKTCRAIGLKSGHQQLQNLPENEKLNSTLWSAGQTSELHTVESRYQRREIILITLAGMFRLIFQSRKAEAEELKTLILEKVLTSVFQQGTYPPRDLEAPLRVPPQLVQWCPQDDDFRRLCVRQQILVAERLAVVAEIEAAPHRGITQRCRDVAAARQHLKGFSYSIVHRFHRKWCQSGRNWRALQCGKPPGRPAQRLLADCCERKEAA